MVAHHDEIRKVRVVASRAGEQDVMTVHIESAGGDKEAYAKSVSQLLKLKGEIVVVDPGSLPKDGLVIEDQRSYD